MITLICIGLFALWLFLSVLEYRDFKSQDIRITFKDSLKQGFNVMIINVLIAVMFVAVGVAIMYVVVETVEGMFWIYNNMP